MKLGKMRRVLEKRIGNKAVINGKNVIIFSSNDYLGLSAHPAVVNTAMNIVDQFGIGTGGAPGTTGTTYIHINLANVVANFKLRDTAVIFPSGYQANVSLHQALGDKGVVFHLDNRSHPSAVDGAWNKSGADVQRFDHHDLESLNNAIKTNSDKTNIVSLPSVFTVDGEIAPLDKLSKMKKDLDFVLILDEAHATGVLGETGRGLEEYYNLPKSADFIMGTFSKAIGSQGGFVAYNKSSEQYLKSGFRGFDYSTSLATMAAAAALKAFDVLEHDKLLLESLRNSKQLIINKCKQKGINIIARESMIMLILCVKIQQLVEVLIYEGYFTVPVKAMIDGVSTECLRITPMALHTEFQINGFIDSLKKYI